LASTNQTGGLGLPQWEGTDTVEHGDFNGAFAKIDEAIRQINEAIEGRVRKKLLDVTIDTTQNSVTLELPEAELEGLAELELMLDISSNEKCLRINGQTSGYFYSCSASSSYKEKMTLSGGIGRISIIQGKLIYCPAAGDYYCTASGARFLPPKTLEIFCDGNNSQLSSGDRITVWGIKR